MPNELRVFLSSTFRDLQAEREHLVKRIFPEIRALCRERGVTFTEIDLRWGLTEEEGALGRIIGACLDEVDRCRPYFIGIFGERYGWVPPFREIYKDPNLLQRHPWVEEAAADGMGLMEMEVRHGVLNAIAAGERRAGAADGNGAFFYARTHRHRRRQDDAVERDARLQRLIDDVAAGGLPLREFRTPEGLGEMVYDDLVALIERDFAAIETSPLDDIRRHHEGFAASRRQAYIPNVETLRALDEFVGADDVGSSGLAVTGDSGIGKSALVAYWAHRFRRRNPGTFVVEHYAGIGVGSGDRYDIVRHLLLEIAERCGIDDPLPDDPRVLLTTLPEWLSRLDGTPMVIVLDGINQLPEGEQDLEWFPAPLPASIRLIVTRIVPPRAEPRAERTWRTLALGPLTHEECEAITVRFLNEYHKGLSRDRVARIAAAPQTRQPLFLRVLLEELRLYGRHEELDGAISHYLAASDAAALFQRVLERLEDDCGRRDVEEVMRLIACARYGLSESELSALTLISRLDLTLLLTALDYHLLQRSGLYTFFHTYLAHAVEHRYLSDPATRRATHHRIAAFFAAEPATQRRIDEEPWGWERSGENARLVEALSTPTLFTMMSEGERAYELIGYWNRLAPEPTPRAAYRAMIRAERERGVSRYDLGVLLRRVGEFLTTFGDYEGAEWALRAAVMTLRAEVGQEHEETMRAVQGLATLYYYRRLPQRAEPLFRTLLAIRRERYGLDHPETIAVMSDLGAVLHKHLERRWDKGSDIAEIEELFRTALASAERIYGAEHPKLSEYLNNLATVLKRANRNDEALLHLERALHLNRQFRGPVNAEVSANLTNLSLLHAVMGDLTKAKEYASEAREIGIHLWGEKHPLTLLTKSNLAQILKKCGEYDAALHHLYEILFAYVELYGEQNIRALELRRSIAFTLYEKGDAEASMELLTDLLLFIHPFKKPDDPWLINAVEQAVRLTQSAPPSRVRTDCLAAARLCGWSGERVPEKKSDQFL